MLISDSIEYVSVLSDPKIKLASTMPSNAIIFTNQRFNPHGYPRNFESVLETEAAKNGIWPFTSISSNSGVPGEVSSPASFCCGHTNIGCKFKEYIQQIYANTGCQAEDFDG